MKLIKSKKGIALLAVLAIVAISAVGAYAYFSTTGHGSGSGKVGTSTAFTIASDAYTGGPLTPAGGAGTYESVKYRVTNPSTGSQNLNQVVVSVAGTALNGSASTFDISGGTTPDCTAGDFQLSVDGGTTWGAAGASVTDTSLASDLLAGATTSSDGTVLIRMIDTTHNQDNCQGATVPLYFAAS